MLDLPAYIRIGSAHHHYVYRLTAKPENRALSQMGLAAGPCNNRLATALSIDGTAELHRSATDPSYDDTTSSADIYYFNEELPVYELVPWYKRQREEQEAQRQEQERRRAALQIDPDIARPPNLHARSPNSHHCNRGDGTNFSDA